MGLTSRAGIAQARLQNSACASEVDLALRGLGRLRQIEIVLRQCDHQFRVIVDPNLLYRAAGAEQARRVVAQGRP